MSKVLGLPTVLMGHERSADEGNGMLWNGREVNHQYDKSSQFMHLAKVYVHCHIDPSLEIQSGLADMWEIEIAQVFCMDCCLRPFHHLFISCNEPLNNGNDWCCKCEKCCFVFLLFSAWLRIEEVTSIFGCNLFEKESLIPTFLSLVGGADDGAKPFECVGTFQEASAAAEMAIMRYALTSHPGHPAYDPGYDPDTRGTQNDSCNQSKQAFYGGESGIANADGIDIPEGFDRDSSRLSRLPHTLPPALEGLARHLRCMDEFVSTQTSGPPSDIHKAIEHETLRILAKWSEGIDPPLRYNHTIT
jgi:hypothetical protein